MKREEKSPNTGFKNSDKPQGLYKADAVPDHHKIIYSDKNAY